MHYVEDNGRNIIHPDIRIFGPEASVAQDLEPEYIAVDPNSSRAWVVLQENNAIAVLDIANATISKMVSADVKILPLETKTEICYD